MAKELKLDKAKILSQLRDLQSVSGEWVLEYDPDVDQLFFGVKRVPKGSFLVQLSDEINLFLDKNSKLSGMFIEYFKDNYLEHNKELIPVLQSLEDGGSVPSEIQEIERVALEKDLFFEALASLVDRDEIVTAVA
ncbi:hypothetical protein FWH58_03080 [Candidatus Saccharibacteria bacterium]|nr:hypothetical protein [Candidatus Saccharibacteria bacterium]